MYYQPTSQHWQDLLANTELATMRYTPSIFTLNAHWQLFWHGLNQAVQATFVKMPYRREILELSDGGEIGLDWLIHLKEAVRDLVVVVPGLSGDSGELYCRTVARACQEANLDCVFVNYRGLAGVPLKVRLLSL